MPTKEYFKLYYITHRKRILDRMNAYNREHIIERKEYDKIHYLLTKDKSISSKIKIEQSIKITFD